MAGKIVDSGERLLSDTAFTALGGNVVKLAKNPFTLSDAQELVDFVEADYDGYIPQPFLYAGLLPANPGGRAIATFLTVMFACGGATVPNQIYGYWVESAAGVIIAVERFAGIPRQMVAPGDSITIDVTIRLWSPL